MIVRTMKRLCITDIVCEQLCVCVCVCVCVRLDYHYRPVLREMCSPLMLWGKGDVCLCMSYSERSLLGFILRDVLTQRYIIYI